MGGCSINAGKDFTEFCDATYANVVSALAGMCGDGLIAEELAQEAFARAYARWRHVQAMDNPAGWVFIVGANMGRSRIRRIKVERRALQRYGSREMAESAAADEVGIDGALVRVLHTLSDRHRRILIMRFVLDMSVSDVATDMKMSDEAVRAMTSRALTKVRQQYPVQEASQ